MQKEWTIGPMYLRFEEPDVLLSRGEGTMDAESIRAFNRKAEELAATHGRLFLLADMSKAAGMSPEARKASSEFTSGETPFRATVVYGASFAMRTAVNMMMRATVLLGRKEMHIWFAESEADARAWIAEQRAKSQAGA